MYSLEFSRKVDCDVHLRENVVSNPTTLSDDEGFEVLHSHLAKLDPVFGSFILSVNNQYVTPL